VKVGSHEDQESLIKEMKKNLTNKKSDGSRNNIFKASKSHRIMNGNFGQNESDHESRMNKLEN